MVYDVLMRTFLLTLMATATLCAADPAKVTLGDHETIAFFGDSITEQHLTRRISKAFWSRAIPAKN